jgi:TPR repeat protein
MNRHIEPKPASRAPSTRSIDWRLPGIFCLLTLLGACGSPPERTPNTLYEPQRLDRANAQTGIQTDRLLPPAPKSSSDDTAEEATEVADDTQPAADQPPPATDAETGNAPEIPRLSADEFLALEEKANQGDTDAQFELGDLLHRGVRVKRNLPLAVNWFDKAATAGDHRAQYALGDIYYNGRAGSTDYEKARSLWLDAAVQGNDMAQLKLGYMYSEGLGVTQDYSAAQRWYLKAASMGNAEAQTLLGSLLHEGNRIEHDYEQAFKWYKLAAEQGHAHAQYTLGTLFHDGLGTPVDYLSCAAWVDVAVSNGYDDHLDAKSICTQTLDDDQKTAAQQLADQLKAQYGPQRAGLL